MSLTFQWNINLHMFRDEFVVKKRFLTSAVHIPKQSLISVDTTSLKQRANQEVTRVTFKSCVISRLPLGRPSGDLRLVTDKTTKNKPRVDYELRSAHGRAVNDMR